MQMMSDAVTVLGSRHGIFLQPFARQIGMIRCGLFPGIDAELQVGLHVNDKTFCLPLCTTGESFAFGDQDITPCTTTLTGIDPQFALKLELTITTPFRPRDAAFSTTPVLDLQVSLSRVEPQFRWQQPQAIEGEVTIFLELTSDSLQTVSSQQDRLDFSFAAPVYQGFPAAEPVRHLPQHDAWLCHAGGLEGRRVVATMPADEIGSKSLHVSWCTWSDHLLEYRGEPAPFKYTEAFDSLDEVVAWAQSQPTALRDNAARVDGILASHNLSRSTSNMLALTLHSWLANTWWCKTDERDLFTVWEGSCYYHSTVDVEYTQTPFYLAVWPELLGLQLDQWPDFVISGEDVIGKRGTDTVVFMHDMGQHCEVDTTRYNHPMPVEENTNYVLMSYACWRRSGDHQWHRRNARVIEQALDFVVACDTTGNGVPDLGMSNTIDDASPAVQFGKEQIYLAVKAMAALDAGADLLEDAGLTAKPALYRETASRIAAVIRVKGWQDDHFVTLLDNSAEGVVNAWTGETYDAQDVLPGWDAAHIYTANGICLFDMTGRKVDLDENRLRQDLRVATERCLDKHGCRHSDYQERGTSVTLGEGGETKLNTRIGWIAMNIMRDISALYRKVDLRALMDRYWDYQVTVNTQGPHLFFETFNGNNLMTYPRGVVVWGYLDAVGGIQLDLVGKRLNLDPYDAQVRVPLLSLADWQAGIAPMIANGRLLDPTDLANGLTTTC